MLWPARLATPEQREWFLADEAKKKAAQEAAEDVEGGKDGKGPRRSEVRQR